MVSIIQSSILIELIQLHVNCKIDMDSLYIQSCLECVNRTIHASQHYYIFVMFVFKLPCVVNPWSCVMLVAAKFLKLLSPGPEVCIVLPLLAFVSSYRLKETNFKWMFSTHLHDSPRIRRGCVWKQRKSSILGNVTNSNWVFFHKGGRGFFHPLRIRPHALIVSRICFRCHCAFF